MSGTQRLPQSITVRKHDWRGTFRYAWKGELLSRDTDQLVIFARWEGPGEPRVGEVAFVPGDLFVEHYYPGRSYAIWEVQRPDGTVKAWYCNISTPVVEDAGTLSFNDLLLDVLAYPDGRYAVLDRDEFEEARQEGLIEEQVLLAEQALKELIGLIEAGAAPFTFARGSARLLVL